eukprot:PhM_4_TR16806/c2_g1_i8/m.52007
MSQEPTVNKSTELKNSPDRENNTNDADERAERCPPSLLTVAKELREHFGLPPLPELEGEEGITLAQFISAVASLVTGSEPHAATPELVINQIMCSSSSVIGALVQYLQSARRSLDMCTVVLILVSRIMRFGTPQHRRHMFVFAMPSIMRLAWYNEFIDTRGNAQMMIDCLLAVEMGSRLSVSCVLPAVAHVLSRYTQRRILCHGADTVIRSCLTFLVSCVVEHSTPHLVVEFSQLKDDVVRDILRLLKAPPSDLRLHASRSHDYVQRKALLANGDCIRGILQYVPPGAKFNDVVFLCKDWFYDVVCDDACLYDRGQVNEPEIVFYGVTFLTMFMERDDCDDDMSVDYENTASNDEGENDDDNDSTHAGRPQVDAAQIVVSKWRDIHHDTKLNINVSLINDILHLLKHPVKVICCRATLLLASACKDSDVARAVPTHAQFVDHMRRLLLHKMTHVWLIADLLVVIRRATEVMTALDFRLCVEQGVFYAAIPRTLHNLTSVPEPDEDAVVAMTDLLCMLAIADIITQPLVDAQQRQRLINVEHSRWCVANLETLLAFPFLLRHLYPIHSRTVSVEEELSGVVMPDPESLSARGHRLVLPGDSDSFRSCLLAQMRFAIGSEALLDMVRCMFHVLKWDKLDALDQFSAWALTSSELMLSE